MKRNSSHNYQKRLIVIYMLCIFITLVPLLILTNIWVKPQNLIQTNLQMSELLESKANEIGFWLDQRISEIRVIHSYYQVSGMDLDSIKPFIKNADAIVKNAYGNPEETYAIGKTDGLGWINDTLTIDVSNRDYFKEAMLTQKEYVISEPVVSKSDNEQIFLLCYPIRDEFNTTVGFINGSVNLKQLFQFINEIQIFDGTTWIMNKKSVVYTYQEEVEKLYGDYLNDIVLASQKGNGSQEVIVNGEKVTIFYSSVPNADNWLLCDAISTAKLTAPTAKFVNNLIACIILAAVLVYLASYFLSKKLVSENEHLVEEVSIIYERERKAQIQALQSQINPHFLYNSLDTIQWRAIDYNAFDIAEMIQKLSQIFRISLSDGKEYIPVEKEIEHVQCYLDIQKIRYKEKINYVIQVDESAKPVTIPKLIIQPLVENSIYHGIKEMKQNGHIDIQLQHIDSHIVIRVQDDGVGMSDEKLIQLKKDLSNHVESEHYGLFNIYEKLYLTYGTAFSFELSNEKGFCVTLKLPDKIGDENNAAGRTR